MKRPSLATQFLLAAVVWVAVAGIHFGLSLRRNASAPWPGDLLYAAMLFCACMGWVGLAELRRLGMRKLVRAVQLLVVVLAVPVILIPSAISIVALIAAAAVMLAACVAAVWHRRRAPIAS